MSDVKLVTLTEATLDTVPMLCGHSHTYRAGYNAKLDWMEARLRDGMRYVLVQVRGRNAGMIEYIPGEYAWRGVEAKGYLFIHCFWVVGRNRGHGYGRMLLEACLEDARGANGIAVLASKAHWLPVPKLFLKNGFELAGRSGPFDLLVKRLRPEASLPRFKRSKAVLPHGLTLYHSDQCPYTQNVPGIVERVGEQTKIPVNIVKVTSARAAQAAPCPYGTLGYFFNGEFLTHRPIGTKQLIELLEPKPAGRAG